MIETGEILQTMRMIQEENFDIRTITLGINLLDCAEPEADRCADRVYDKICYTARNLVHTGEEIEKEFGIPIVNKRISVTPVSMISQGDPVPIARALDRAAKEVGVNFLGGFSALMHKGATKADERLLASIPQVMSETELLCSSVNVASTRAGINMNAVREMGQIIKKTAEATASSDGLGCAKLVVFANAVEDNPFMAASRRLNIPFGIVDLSLAPTPARGDSVAHILTEMGLEYAGAPGTTAALALLNDAVKKGGIMASNHVGGLSGAFIPVSEDIGMIEAASAGALSLEKLEAMTCVCSVGLDMIAIPGDTSAETISGIIADEAAIGMINNKTTAVRVIPAVGKKAGDTVEFGGLLGHAPVMPVNGFSNREFIARGGRIPAPLHSMRN